MYAIVRKVTLCIQSDTLMRQNFIKKVLQWTGIPVSIGIAETKTLAKVANRIAKKEVSSGVFCLHCPNMIRVYFKRLPVSKLWGVGQRYAEMLKL